MLFGGMMSSNTGTRAVPTRPMIAHQMMLRGAEPVRPSGKNLPAGTDAVLGRLTWSEQTAIRILTRLYQASIVHKDVIGEKNPNHRREPQMRKYVPWRRSSSDSRSNSGTRDISNESLHAVSIRRDAAKLVGF